MSTHNILQEVSPLSEKDCFYIIKRKKAEFDYPIHTHSVFELNFVGNAKYAQRIVGDSIEEINDIDLCLITGANLEHAWINGNCHNSHIEEITLQFHEDIFAHNLGRNQYRMINEMFRKAQYGLHFSRKATERIYPQLHQLVEKEKGFHSLLLFMEILYELSLDEDCRILSSSTFVHSIETSNSRRVSRVLDYIKENYQQKIRLGDVAQLVNMNEVSFSRFIKKRTGKTFIDYVLDVRVGSAARMMVDTSKSISEICYECGFNNLSNFNRIFKKKKGFTPKEFRANYEKKMILI